MKKNENRPAGPPSRRGPTALARPGIRPLLLAAALLGTGGPAPAQTGAPGGAPAGAAPLPTERLSPRLRVQLLPAPALAAIEPHRIEPFLAEPLIVDDDTLRQAPRIVAAPEGRVLITLGDPAYARGPAGSALDAAPGTLLRIFRESRTLRDPVTQAVLGHEAHYVGRARLQQPQGAHASTAPAAPALPVPAVLEILFAREEVRAGDRLLPEPARPLMNYLPHAPQITLDDARVAAMQGDAVGMAGQNQVVVINKGLVDGVASGQVFSIVKSGPQVSDRTVRPPERVQLPDERDGLLMVFRPFERLSYALVLETRDGVKVGDRIVPAP